MTEIHWQLFWILMILHCLIGTAAAFVAKSRARNFNIWLGWGLLGGTIALITVFLMPAKNLD
ncbi:MAG: hypothetical protein QNJ74_25225 [Trichodesmium sp. MO_231.B1]|nr:hypothetical protein [Trichodesmium sp. MO_231.B1]